MCAERCFGTPGCHRFMFHSTNQCEIIFSSDRAQRYIYQANKYQAFVDMYPDDYQRITGTAGSVGTPECDEPPFEDEYATNSYFSCKFRGLEDQEAMIEKLKTDNGVTSDTPIGQWKFEFDFSKIHSSSYTLIESGQLDDSGYSYYYDDYYTSDGYGCAEGECKWSWINFRVTTYSRFLPEFAPDGSRKRRSTPDALAAVRKLSDPIVNKLMTDITLPDGAEVLETTPVETEITMQAPNGDTSGECGDEGCSCVNGYEKEESGKCVPPADTNDTCSSASDICSDDASCTTYSNGGSQCICNTGFDGDGINCADINECENDVCPARSTCDNTDGAFECTCHEGYQKIGKFCVDVNECQDSPCDGENQSCKNTDGSYECQCQTGYNLIGGDCELAVGLKTINDLVDELESTLDANSDSNEKWRNRVRRRLARLTKRMKRNFVARITQTGCDNTTTIGKAITDDAKLNPDCQKDAKPVQTIFVTFANWVNTYNRCGDGNPNGKGIGGKISYTRIQKQLERVRTKAYDGIGC